MGRKTKERSGRTAATARPLLKFRTLSPPCGIGGSGPAARFFAAGSIWA
jgi:hypothetical protein